MLADAAKCDSTKLFNYHFEMITRNGIFFLPGKLGAFSDAHSTIDVKNMKNATERILYQSSRNREIFYLNDKRESYGQKDRH